MTLSHGGTVSVASADPGPLRIGLTLGLIAMLARVGAPFASATYFTHLSYAALLWMGGMLCWGSYLLIMIGER